MVNAINLDGGGSTQFVGKTLENNTLHHINSPSENRKVINALAVTSTAESGAAVGVLCDVEGKSVLSGDSIAIKVTPYDRNYNPPAFADGTVTWEVSRGMGYVSDNVFYPQGSGEVTVSALYNGKKTDSFTLNIIDNVTGIIADETYSLETGKTASLSGKVKVFDEAGHTATVNNIDLLNPVVYGNNFSFFNGTITMTSQGGGVLTLSRDGASRNIRVVTPGSDIDINSPVTTDFLNVEKEIGNTFNIYSSSDMNTLFDRVVYSNAMNVLEKSDVSAIVGGEKPADLTPKNAPIIAGNYIERTHSYGKFVSMQMDNGVISRGTQWTKLSEALNSAQKNVFILLDKAPAFSTEIDRKAFDDMLSKAAKNKNVFVISSGSENFCRIENGVRYLTLANIRDEKTIEKSVEKVCYLSFRLTTSGASYTFKNLFD